jgi:two-component system chemotaxis response regulator CheB
VIKVVIVDDLKTVRYALRRALESDSQVLVVAEAATGAEALRMIDKFNPDLVTMDIHLEKENGLDVTSTIMSRCPRPILVVTGVNPTDPGQIYKAIGRGALDVFPKLPAPGSPEYDGQRRAFLRLVKTLSSVPVLTRRTPNHAIANDLKVELSPPLLSTIPPRTRVPTAALLIGASTGGPPVLCNILSALKKPFRIPVVIVQHISAGFAAGFARWLGQTSGFRTVLATKHVTLEPGVVYVAPDSQHIRFVTGNNLTSSPAAQSDPISPSIDKLFESAATLLGARALGVLLTGMGRDGAAGLKALRDAGARTIAQAPETCAVDSMPKTAILLEGASKVLRPEHIADTVNHIILDRINS